MNEYIEDFLMSRMAQTKNINMFVIGKATVLKYCRKYNIKENIYLVFQFDH